MIAHSLTIPCNGEINLVAQNLPPVSKGCNRWSCVGANAAIVVCKLVIVLDNTVIELDDVRILL